MSAVSKKLWEFVCEIERLVKKESIPTERSWADLPQAARAWLNGWVREIHKAMGTPSADGKTSRDLLRELRQKGKFTREDAATIALRIAEEVEGDEKGAMGRPGANVQLQALKLAMEAAKVEEESDTVKALKELLEERGTVVDVTPRKALQEKAPEPSTEN